MTDQPPIHIRLSTHSEEDFKKIDAGKHILTRHAQKTLMNYINRILQKRTTSKQMKKNIFYT